MRWAGGGEVACCICDPGSDGIKAAGESSAGSEAPGFGGVVHGGVSQQGGAVENAQVVARSQGGGDAAAKGGGGVVGEGAGGDVALNQADIVIDSRDGDGGGGGEGIEGKVEGIGDTCIACGIALGCGDRFASALADGCQVGGCKGVGEATGGIGCAGAQGGGAVLDGDEAVGFCRTDHGGIACLRGNSGVGTTDGGDGNGGGYGIKCG